MNFVDLAVSCFDHRGDHGNLRCLRESAEFIGGYGEIGAQSLIDFVVSNMQEISIQVVAQVLISSAIDRVGIDASFGIGDGGFILLVHCSIGVLGEMSFSILVGFPITQWAIKTHQEELSPKT